MAREPDGAGLAPPESDGQLVDEGEIGSGGSGSVRKAYDPNLRRQVATKVLSPNLVKSPDFMRRFVEEARVMAKARSSQHRAGSRFGGRGAKTGYIVMKLVRGRTLEAIVNEARDREQGADLLHNLLAAFLKVCDALAFAHSRGVIHCDLKPANIMVGNSARCT